MRRELGVPRIRAVSAALVTLAAIAASVTMGSAATAGSARHIPRQPGAPAQIHYMPPRPSSPNRVASNLMYRGGPVMLRSNTYSIFWEPKKVQNGDPAFVAKGFNAGVIRYFKDVGGTGLCNNNSSTTRSSVESSRTSRTSRRSRPAGVDAQSHTASGCNDPATPGNCLSDAQIRAEVTHAQQVNGWSAAPTNAFFVFTARRRGLVLQLGRIVRVHLVLRLPQFLR
jgi:hypothetical protein